MTNWKEYDNSFLDFTEEITQKWIDLGFNKESCREWLNIGCKVSDSDYCCWLRDVKKKNAKWVLDYSYDRNLRERYNEYLASPQKNQSQVQQYLEKNYPQQQRWSIEKLDLSNQNLVGDLDLTDFWSLQEIIISGNQIGNNANFKSYHNQLTVEEITEELLETKIEQPPK